jgi:hypothetical protein
MTLKQMVDAVLSRSGEDETSPVFHTRNDAVAALNEAQQIYAFLTLCIERTEPFPVSAAANIFNLDRKSVV